jgi:ribosome-associated protein
MKQQPIDQDKPQPWKENWEENWEEDGDEEGDEEWGEDDALGEMAWEDDEDADQPAPFDEDQDDLDDEGDMEVIWVQGGTAAAGHADADEDSERVYAERPNKSALKREMQALQDLGERLLEFSPERLLPLQFSDKLMQALAEGRRLKVANARRRHLRYLARLLGQEDSSAAEQFIAEIDARHASNTRQFHQLEQWRDRLILEGDAALAELLQAYPEADRQQLRQLIRNAQREQAQDKPPASARKLFKLLRALAEA